MLKRYSVNDSVKNADSSFYGVKKCGITLNVFYGTEKTGCGYTGSAISYILNAKNVSYIRNIKILVVTC